MIFCITFRIWIKVRVWLIRVSGTFYGHFKINKICPFFCGELPSFISVILLFEKHYDTNQQRRFSYQGHVSSIIYFLDSISPLPLLKNGMHLLYHMSYHPHLHRNPLFRLIRCLSGGTREESWVSQFNIFNYLSPIFCKVQLLHWYQQKKTNNTTTTNTTDNTTNDSYRRVLKKTKKTEWCTGTTGTILDISIMLQQRNLRGEVMHWE